MSRSAQALLGLLLGGLLFSATASVAEASEPQAGPKVAVLVAGDPDSALVAEAASVRAAVEAAGTLLSPGDATLVGALEGAQAPAEDDGLSQVRAMRRRLGLSEAGDRELLGQLGRVTGAVALLVVARAPGPQLSVFDVGRGAFFADKLALPADPAALTRFVERRAVSASRHINEPRAEAPRAEAPDRGPATADAPTAATAPAAAAEALSAAPAALDAPPAAPAAPPGDEERKPRIRPAVRRGLAYGAAGALLAGALSFVLVTQLRDDPPPIIHIRPGGQ